MVPVCSPGHTALDRKPCKWWIKLSQSEGIPMGFHKHSFSLLGTLQIFLNGNSFAVTLCVYIHTNTQLYLCLFFKKKNDLSPLLASTGPFPLEQARGGGRNRGSGVARGLAFQLQEPPPSSYSSSPSCLPHYSGKNGGLCSSHQLIPVECSRHGAHHGGQLTANTLFIELAMEMGMWNRGHCGKC